MRSTIVTHPANFGDKSQQFRKKRNSYSLAVKRQAIERVEANLNDMVKFPIRETALELNIAYDLVQKWWSERDKFTNNDADGNIRRVGSSS